MYIYVCVCVCVCNLFHMGTFINFVVSSWGRNFRWGHISCPHIKSTDFCSNGTTNRAKHVSRDVPMRVCVHFFGHTLEKKKFICVWVCKKKKLIRSVLEECVKICHGHVYSNISSNLNNINLCDLLIINKLLLHDIIFIYLICKC